MYGMASEQRPNNYSATPAKPWPVRKDCKKKHMVSNQELQKKASWKSETMASKEELQQSL